MGDILVYVWNKSRKSLFPFFIQSKDRESQCYIYIFLIKVLEVVFSEMMMIERDLEFIQQHLQNIMSIGVIQVDITDYRRILTKEMGDTIKKLKEQIVKKFQFALQQNIELEDEISQKLSQDPKSIEEFIRMKQYLESEEIKDKILKMEMYLEMSYLL